MGSPLADPEISEKFLVYAPHRARAPHPSTVTAVCIYIHIGI